MSQRKADTYYEMLYRFSKALEELNLKYWLVGGTLIGAIRESAILSWDKDADVGMLEKDRKKLWKNKIILHKWGLKTNYTDSIYRIDFKDVYMDIFTYEFRNGRYQDIHEQNRYRWPNDYFKKHQLFPLTTARFGPLKSPVPSLSKVYLKQLYGDWYNIPKQYKNLNKFKIFSSKSFRKWIKNHDSKIIPHNSIETFANQKISKPIKICVNVVLYIGFILLTIYSQKYINKYIK